MSRFLVTTTRVRLAGFVSLAIAFGGLSVSARPARAQTIPQLSPGRVHVVVFAGRAMEFVTGARVTVAGAGTAQTDRRGTAFVTVPPGSHTIDIHIPQGALPIAPDAAAIDLVYERVDVVIGGTTRLMITVAADGEVEDLDLFVPEGLVPEIAPPPGAAGEEPLDVTAAGEAGAVSGHVTAPGGAPVPGAKIYVLGAQAEAETSADGRFSLSLPEGVYTLSIVHVDFTGQTLEGVMVAPGRQNELAIALAPAPRDMADFVVRGRRVRGAAAAVIEERRSSAAVSDAVGAEDIGKSPDSTASAATRRIVGATIQNGQFLLVRGLSGRYVNVRLNGVPMPSTDPDVPGFQLDLFPASMLSGLHIAKTFTPDIPGDFAGGSMNVVTRDYPDRFLLTASVSLSSNSETLGRDLLTYPGGDLDWLGIDDGTRALPERVPSDARLAGGRNGLDDDVIERASRDFRNQWQTDPNGRVGLPNLSLGFTVGNTTRAFGRRLGYLLTFGYRYQLRRYVEELARYDLSEADHTSDRIDREVSREEASTGVLGTVSHELGRGHDLTLVSLSTQSGEDNTASAFGFSETEDTSIDRTTFRFVERRLLFNQLLGNHDLRALRIDWQVNASTFERDQPDTRNMMYIERNGEFIFNTVTSSGERLFTGLSTLEFGGGLDVTIPIDATQLKAGYMGRKGDQEFSARRFAPVLESQTGVDRSLPPNELFAPGNVGTIFTYEERTNSTDGYEAGEELHAGYGLVDSTVFDWLRLTTGARVESFQQEITARSPFASGRMADREVRADRTETDVLPAGSLVFGLSPEMSVRAAYGGTVARPLVRELAPFSNQDYIKRRSTTGNPDLVRTYIHNFDVRWEMFPGATEVVAASAFYKIFEHPIETVILDNANNLGLANAERARNFGLELEARFGLGRLVAGLEDFTLLANFAWIYSRISLSEEDEQFATTRERPMAGQSPYVANLSLGYSDPGTGLSLHLFYNVFGPRIVEVGRSGLPNTYEQPIHALDVTASYPLNEGFKLTASGTNLLRQPVSFEQDDVLPSRRHEGIGFGVGLSYTN